MTIEWKDLPSTKTYRTARNAVLVDLRHSTGVCVLTAGMNVTVVQKYTEDGVTYYRTQKAAKDGLDWALKASALGLPNDKAPEARTNSRYGIFLQSSKQKLNQTTTPSKSGGEGWFHKLLRRKNG